jgi:nicotinate phosphoribosyltransferase
MTSALHTDRYEFTMLDPALANGRAQRTCVFEVFARRLSGGRRYGVLAGTGRVLDAIDNFRFDSDTLAWLQHNRIVSADTLDFLSSYRFTGDVRGYAEGELYFPGSPVLEVEGSFAEAVILETVILSILNYDSAVATAASRMVSAASGRPIAEMGSRRANENAAVAAARAAHIAGFTSTSNLQAGREWGVPTMGTAAHAFTLLHDSEEEAFRAQVAAFGPGTTLLVDTFDIREGIETAIRVAGTGLGAVRIDSGDLPSLIGEVREQLDSLGATRTRITVTNDLNENTIAALRGAPVDFFGVGTSVVTGSGSPAAGMVYKLVEHTNDAGERVSVAKRSPEKQNPAGRKTALREIVDGTATAEIVVVGDSVGSVPGRPLVHELVVGGAIDSTHRGADGVQRAREHHATVIAELPVDAFRLSAGDPILPTIFR